jgi:hypothetical protein
MRRIAQLNKQEDFDEEWQQAKSVIYRVFYYISTIDDGIKVLAN